MCSVCCLYLVSGWEQSGCVTVCLVFISWDMKASGESHVPKSLIILCRQLMFLSFVDAMIMLP